MEGLLVQEGGILDRLFFPLTHAHTISWRLGKIVCMCGEYFCMNACIRREREQIQRPKIECVFVVGKMCMQAKIMLFPESSSFLSRG